mgnify:CR=1 FL=1
MIPLLLIAAAATQPAPKVGPVDHLKKRVVEAIRNCPEAKEGEIVVCAPDHGISESYRIPRLAPRFAQQDLRPSGRGTVSDGAGAAGIGSCSNVGAGGAIGCSKADYGAWAAERRRQRAEQRGGLDPR